VSPRIVVLGAGIAGLVAAWELALRGLRPLVLEAAPIAGGRTSTWRDEQGRLVDTGLHVVADHYLNLQQVLARLDVAERLLWVEKHTYLRAGRAPMAWYFSPYKPPFHLLRPAREMPLSPRTRLFLGRVALVLASMDQSDLAALDGETYLEWHNRMGLGRDFMLELAEAAGDAATFLPVDRASARAVISWLKYLMRHRRAGDVGLFRGTLAEAMIDPLVRAITALGGEVRLGSALTRLLVDEAGRRATHVEVAPSRATGPVHAASGEVAVAEPRERIACDHLISALSVQGLQRALTASGTGVVAAAGLEAMMGLRTTPALSLIATFDRPITPVPEGAPLCTGVAMRDFIDLKLLERDGLTPGPGSTYQFVITRSDTRFADPEAKIVADIVADLVAVWPGARGARVVAHALERIGAAMFAAVPGAHALRPGVATRLTNLSLAGDFTHHELNASMEGAAFSGRRAADAVLRALGQAGLEFPALPDETMVPLLRNARRRLSRSEA
jgi:15-cis-phytoene desaturase